MDNNEKKDSLFMQDPEKPSPKKQENKIILLTWEQEEEERKKERARNISIKEGSGYSFSDGFGFRYISPYALFLGASNSAIGLLSALPPLLGNIAQLFTIRILSRFSRKKIVSTGVFLQAFMWLSLICMGILYFFFNLSSKIAVPIFVVLYTILVVCGNMTVPAWSSWMKDLVTRPIEGLSQAGAYFGKRNRICGLVALICMIVAGIILDHSNKLGMAFYGFAFLFLVSFAGRFVSGYLFTKQYEPEFKQDVIQFGFFDFALKLFKNNFGRFVAYVTLISFATAVSSPFFTVYMLEDLHFSYFVYMTIIIGSSLSTIIFMPVWGKFADIYGNIRVIRICGPLVCLVPFFWLFASHMMKFGFTVMIIYLLVIELLSGLIWAGFNLSAGNFIYDAVTRPKISLCVAYFNIINGVGALIGALIGAWIAEMNISFLGFSGLLFVFFISFVLRFGVHVLMIGTIKEVRPVREFNIKEAKENITGLSMERIVRIFR
jgi:MFS family permease